MLTELTETCQRRSKGKTTKTKQKGSKKKKKEVKGKRMRMKDTETKKQANKKGTIPHLCAAANALHIHARTYGSKCLRGGQTTPLLLSQTYHLRQLKIIIIIIKTVAIITNTKPASVYGKKAKQCRCVFCFLSSYLFFFFFLLVPTEEEIK